MKLKTTHYRLQKEHLISSDKSWKEKYFLELESAEDREKQWETERNTLGRILVRASLASKGLAPELDRLLDRVRSDLRKNRVDADSSSW